MKLNLSSLAITFFIAFPFLLSGQSNTATSSAPTGTTLGSNDTIAYEGIALTNRLKLRGYVDFIYGYGDLDEIVDDSRFSTAADMDFLFDFSPVTGEIHLRSSDTNGIELEQAYARYSFNQDFNLSFGRQLTSLSYEADEAPGLFAVSKGYFMDAIREHNALQSAYGEIASAFNKSTTAISSSLSTDASKVESAIPQLRRNYVDGIRGNFNNGMVGITLGLHDGYWLSDHFNDNAAIDVAASVMIIPGLEARLGYAHQDCDSTSIDDIGHVNAWIEFNPGDLTLALEYDHFDFGDDSDSDLWDIMFLLNYQFVDWFGATLRYSHEDFEDIAGLLDLDYESDRITLAFLFSITNNLALNFEFTHTEIDVAGEDLDADEFYVEGLFTF